MAKIARKNMKIFGTNSGFQQMEQFGSLAAGSPNYTTDPETIQALSNYGTGWFAGVVGSNAPAIEDMNALCYLFAYQLSYLFQEGIPEWNSLTTYFIGSVVQDGSGTIYVSLTDNNLNNVVTDATNWRGLSNVINNRTLTTTGSVTASDAGNLIYLNPSAAFNIQLPAPSTLADRTVYLKDISGSILLYPVTLLRSASETIEGLGSNYTLNANNGSWSLYSDGTNYKFIF